MTDTTAKAPRFLDGKRILITGGTGSLGKVLVRRLLSNDAGSPKKIVVFSRDEARQHQMRVDYEQLRSSTDEVIYNAYSKRLSFRIGDIRDYASVAGALQGIDVVFNAAALKQVPTCEYFPHEAVLTNVMGAENIARAIRELHLPVETVVGISTDKAVKPVNVMGMTKALQERILIRANLECPDTRFIVVRYGNVLASRGSVIPLFHQQIRAGGPVTITDAEMTRFLLSLHQACDVIFAALAEARPGETYIPRIPAARMVDVAQALIGSRPVPVRITGIRPGEKMHEILVSEEEATRTIARGTHYVILPILPELMGALPDQPVLGREYSSADDLMNPNEVLQLLEARGLTVDAPDSREGELLA